MISTFRAWRTALAFFILAGLTGLLFRTGSVGLETWGLSLANIRHAHSHTMFFGWVTPALMALIVHRLEGILKTPIRGARYAVAAAFLTALGAFPAFLLSGYAPANIGNSSVPVSVIMAGLNVVAWYFFVGSYWNIRNIVAPTLPIRFFDMALLFLIGATLGAWGLPAVQILSPESHVLKTALTHIFLDWMSEGWFVLGIVGLAAAGVREVASTATWGLRLAVTGLPFTFALGMPGSVVPPVFKILASTGGFLVGTGLLLLVKSLWRHRNSGLWRLALALLAVKAVMLAIASASPGGSWIVVHPYRILYIHVTLLGFVSIGLVAAARDALGSQATRGSSAFVAAVSLMLLSLVPLTPLWPADLAGVWAVYLAGFGGLAVVLAATFMCITLTPRSEEPNE